MPLKIFLGAVSACVIIVIWIYNRIVRDQNRVSEAWSGIDVQLKKRFDLIPNLVSAVDAYKKYESQLFENIASVRAEKLEQTTKTLKGLLSLQEAYPDLKANQNFIKLQDELITVEDHLQYARRYYNGCVRDYNTTISTFPNLLVSKILGLETKAFFEIEFATERKNSNS